LAEGGTPPRFLIIDDGWQQIGSENKEEANAVVQEGAQYVVFVRRISPFFSSTPVIDGTSEPSSITGSC